MFSFEAVILPIAQRRPTTSLIMLIELTFYLVIRNIFLIVKCYFKIHFEDILAFGKIIRLGHLF